MCCHTSHKNRSLYSALHDIDPSIASADQFWHLKGREGDGGIKVSTEEAEKALDAVFLAAISGGSAADDDEDWADVDADERLDQHIAWMKARNELLEDGLTSGQVAALAKYVADKHADAEAAKEAEIAKRVRKEGNKMSPRTKVLVGTLSLLTLASMTGSAMGISTAATPEQAPVAATQQVAAGDILAGQTFTVGGKTVYIGAVKGKCAPGTVKVTNPKTQTLKWVKAGKVISKKVAKGAVICKFVAKNGTTATAPTNASGAITALPSNFPAKPTAADIASLGLTATSKVSPSLRIPQPTGAASAPAQLASKVRPVGVVGVADTPYHSGISTVSNRPASLVTWEFTGGSGVIEYSTQAAPGGEITTHYTKLNPNGTTRVTQPVALLPDEYGNIDGFFSGRILPDYGQASVPASTVSNWNLPAAKDSSGIGMPVGLHANPSYYDASSGPRDGVVRVNVDGSLLGNYNY